MRRRVQFAQGEYYHIFNRGVGRQQIFLDQADYTYVLRAMKRYSQEFSISVIAYNLMPNHYHWLVRQDSELPVRLFPQRIFNGYTKAFNRRHQRSGTLFEGPYRALRVDSDEYLKHLCRYIHANPIKAGLSSTLEAWPYSNIHEWLGKRGGSLVDQQFVETFFADRERYIEWILDYVHTANMPDTLADYLAELEQETE